MAGKQLGCGNGGYRFVGAVGFQPRHIHYALATRSFSIIDHTLPRFCAVIGIVKAFVSGGHPQPVNPLLLISQSLKAVAPLGNDPSGGWFRNCGPGIRTTETAEA